MTWQSNSALGRSCLLWLLAIRIVSRCTFVGLLFPLAPLGSDSSIEEGARTLANKCIPDISVVKTCQLVNHNLYALSPALYNLPTMPSVPSPRLPVVSNLLPSPFTPPVVAKSSLAGFEQTLKAILDATRIFCLRTNGQSIPQMTQSLCMSLRPHIILELDQLNHGGNAGGQVLAATLSLQFASPPHQFG